MKTILLFFTMTVLGAPVWASPKGVPAYRAPHEDWQDVARRLRPSRTTEPADTVEDVSVPLAQVDFSSVTHWESYDILLEDFQKIRDHRFLEDPGQNPELRRSSWLYPDDGCYARAALADRNLESWGKTAPTKVFIFGGLNVETVNTSSGWVTWWYHVAPIVEVDGTHYVLDPAIEPSRPLKLEEWMEKMGTNPMWLSICESTAYTPYSACTDVPEDDDKTAIDDQGYFLSLERDRLIELGRDPEKELGDFPPWLTPFLTH